MPFPPVPNTRYPWARLPGVAALRVQADVITDTATSGEMLAMDSEDSEESFVLTGSHGAGTFWGLGLVFPIALDITHLALGLLPTDFEHTRSVYVSTDNTTPVDGTWTLAHANLAHCDPSPVAYRNGIVELDTPAAGITGLRIKNDQSRLLGISALHLFGGPTTPGDVIAPWHPTLDEPVDAGYFDFGDSPRSTDDTKAFRVKNLSTTQTAEGVELAPADSFDSDPSFTDALTLSDDGSTFVTTLAVGDLAPEAISGVLTLRQDLASDQPLSLWTALIVPTVDAWT